MLTLSHPHFRRCWFFASLAAPVCASLLSERLCAADDPSNLSTAMTRIEASDFGKTADGATVKLFTLRNQHGMTVKVMSLGAILTEVAVPDRKGVAASVILGANSLDAY